MARVTVEDCIDKVDSPISSFVFFGLIGITNGLCNVLGSSTWAEIYGVKYIGSIKALTTALMVFATAFGTAVFGILIDKDFSIEQISLVSASYISAQVDDPRTLQSPFVIPINPKNTNDEKGLSK